MGVGEKEDASCKLSGRVLALQRLCVRLPGRGSNQAEDTTTAVNMLQMMFIRYGSFLTDEA